MRVQWAVAVSVLSLISGTVGLHTVFRTRRSPDDYPDTTLRQRSPHSLPDQWFLQRLDHFRPDNRTWYQRYFTRSSFYEEGGPVFLEVDGEWMADSRALNSGFMVDLAQQYKALMFQLEHRFYGKSRPTGNLSLKNLKYLSSRQALADAAHFISVMNRKYQLPNNTKWIAFGGSYAGNLVAWLRDKYPGHVYGAVASSAPLQARVNFPEFLDEVGFSLGNYSQECARAVNKTFREITRLLRSESGQTTLVDKLGLCGPLNVTDDLDMADLVFTLGDELPVIVESGREEIREFCESLGNSSSKGLLVRYAAAVGFQVDQTGSTCTTTEFDRDIQAIKKDARNKFDFTSSEYQWLYQMCSEFGYFTTSLKVDSLLGSSIPVNFFTQQCLHLFGDQFTLEYVQKRVEHTNKMYGGLDINATRIIFVHGSLDPWRVLGLTETRNPESPVVFIQGESHCTVDWSPQDTDPPELQEARQTISDILGQWLSTKVNSTIKPTDDEQQPKETEKETQHLQESQKLPPQEVDKEEQLLEESQKLPPQEVDKEENLLEESQELPPQEVDKEEQLLEESQELPPQELVLQDGDLQQV